MPRLILESIEKGERTFPLESSTLVGRVPGCQVFLSDTRLSRKHFRIFQRNDTWLLEDLGSRNGTLLNGWKISQGVLDHGDRITAGGINFRFVGDEGARKVGKSLGGYELLDVIGEGGMGTVYRARQISLDRIVALKVLHPRLQKDRSYIDRFMSEARAAARLNHPHVVQVLDVGEDGGTHYFSMEYVDGQSLLGRLRERGPFPPEEMIRIADRVAEALGYAHTHGIIHRDVKPDNILLGRDGEVKLADLGIAKTIQELGVTDGGPRRVLGTPHYLAPEQATGKETGPAADVYSLGATCYHLLTGRLPHRGKDPQEVIRRQITEDPDPIEDLAPDVPPRLAAVVERMMTRDPTARHADMNEVREALAKVRAKARIPAPVVTVEEEDDWIGLRKALRHVLAAGVILAAVWGGVKLGGILLRPGNEEVEAGDDIEAQSLLAAGWTLKEDGHLLEARDRFRELIERYPESRWAVRAESALPEIETALRQQDEERQRGLYDTLLADLAGTDTLEGQRDRLLRFEREHADSSFLSEVTRRRGNVEARIEAARAEAEARARAEGIRIRREAFDAARREAAEALRENDFRAALEIWATFLETHPDPLLDEHRDAQRERQEILRSQASYVDRELRNLAWLHDREQFGEAWHRIGSILTRLTDGPDAGRIRAFREDPATGLLPRLRREMAEARSIYHARTEAYDFEGGVEEIGGILRKVRGSPFEPEVAWLRDRAAILGDLHRETVETILLDRKRFRLDVPAAQGTVVGADAARIFVDLGRGLRTSVPWSELPPATGLEIHLFYRDERFHRTHLQMYVFAERFGLDREVREHRDRIGANAARGQREYLIETLRRETYRAIGEAAVADHFRIEGAGLPEGRLFGAELERSGERILRDVLLVTEPGGTGIELPWEQIPAPTRYAILRHYAGESTPWTELRLALFCEEHGLAEEARDHRARAGDATSILLN